MIRILIILLTMMISVIAPASSVETYVPDVINGAFSLEKESLRVAAPIATSGLVERFNAFENMGVDYEYVSVSDNHDLVVCSDPLNEIGVEITPEGVRVEYRTPRGTVQHSMSFDPEHTYLVLGPQGLRTIPVEPQQGGRELPVLIVHDHKIYEPITYFPSFTLGRYARDVTPLARAVGLMSNWDLLVRLDVSGETVAFDLVKSDGSGAYRVVCDLNTGKAWHEPLPPEEARKLLDLAREDLAKIPRLESGELEDEAGLRLVVYDVTEDKVLLVLARPSLEFIRGHNPRLAELLHVLESTADSLLEWDIFQLSARAREVKDLLEGVGLASTGAIRCLLHPELVLGSYFLASGFGFATFLPWIELLKHLPRLGKAPELRWEPSALLEYAKRLACVGVLYGVELAYWTCCEIAVKVLLRALGLWDYTAGGKVTKLADDVIWAPLFEEPTKRLMSELSGLPRPLVGAWYGLMEAVAKREIGPGRVNVRNAVLRIVGHAVCATLPLPLGALLHSLWADECDFDQFTDYWPGVLGPALSVLGALAENALTGVW